NGTEYVTTANANCCGNNQSFTGGEGGTLGPIRCGIFARTTTTRVQSGATYWGIMEMSGNVFERMVTVGNSIGRTFDGLHGDGELSVNGNANVTNWPGLSGGEITGAAGSGYKMGAYSVSSSGPQYFMISPRIAANNTMTTRNGQYGFRGVHTAPTGVVVKMNIPGQNKEND
ncbi:MAG: hypothetical protein L0Y76_07910, partial [Ignavibacteria bacterium]|nr:hypothetical protein [Ignavibacteria bacterium]